jgi:hypothetical protein
MVEKFKPDGGTKECLVFRMIEEAKCSSASGSDPSADYDGDEATLDADAFVSNIVKTPAHSNRSITVCAYRSWKAYGIKTFDG